MLWRIQIYELKLLPNYFQKNERFLLIIFLSSSLKSLRRAYKGVSSDDQQSIFSPTVAQPNVTQKTFINLDKYVFQLGKIHLSIKTNEFVKVDKYICQFEQICTFFLMIDKAFPVQLLLNQSSCICSNTSLGRLVQKRANIIHGPR